MLYQINKHWLMAAVFDWVVVITAILLSYLHWYFVPVAILVIGNRQHALAILGHDGAHQSVVKRNKRWNDVVTYIFCFIPLNINLKRYRKFHFEHHKNTNNELDPEVALKNIKPNAMRLPYSESKIWKQSFMDLLGFGLPQLIGFMYHIRPRTIKESLPIVFSLCLHAILISLGFWLISLLWLVSLGTSFFAVFRLRVWSEHVGLGENETLIFNPKWWEKALFLPHETWYHKEHHAVPSVPFNKLHTLRSDNSNLKTLKETRNKEIKCSRY